MSRTKYYTTFQVSKLLGVHLATVVNWTKAGHLQAHRTPGGHRRIAEEDLVAFAHEFNMPLSESLGAAPAAQTRILVVDDEPDYLDFVRTFLETGQGFGVETAQSGFEAGRLLEKFQPNLVLLDIRMPGMDGFEVAERLRQERSGKGIPVIAVTAYLGDQGSRERIEREFDGSVEKPVDLDVLLNTIKQALG